MPDPDRPSVISIVGHKNSGKTTLTVRLAAELKNRGRHVASIKHGHHAFEIDRPGTDSWRHAHEGGVSAVLIASSRKLALIEEIEGDEPDPEDLVARFFAGRGHDLVLVEGYKHGPFRKIEVVRRDRGEPPVFSTAEGAAADLFLAVVTDDHGLDTPGPRILIEPGDDHAHVRQAADLVEERVLGSGSPGSER